MAYIVDRVVKGGIGGVVGVSPEAAEDFRIVAEFVTVMRGIR